MNAEVVAVDRVVIESFAAEQPALLARHLEEESPESAADHLSQLDDNAFLQVWERLSPMIGGEILSHLTPERSRLLLTQLTPATLVGLLAGLADAEREGLLELVGGSVRKEIRGVLTYPDTSAGRAMNPRIIVLHQSDTVGAALDRLRRQKSTRVIYTVDDDQRLNGIVTLEALAFASNEVPLENIVEPVTRTVMALDPMEEVLELFKASHLEHLPVVDVDGRLAGHFQRWDMAERVHEEISTDLLSMVGASREERALSPALFAFGKRMGWLQINLLTAFMAAAVVGLFEETIAKFTALAVLLPVVAGQSGNAGAQALAVTMRGLALREITLRHWFRVTRKEAGVGFLNGLAIAVTCGLGVFVWSGSLGLVLVISLSMVFAMIAAGLAGALVPILLTRLGQDPATASSIILTTVTDIAGFFSFLGIATLLSAML